MSETITIRLDRGASSSTTTTSGFKAGECIIAAAPFAKILGETVEFEHTDEFFEEEGGCTVNE